ncbi:MAG TPA: hypothetical protein VM580_00320 [Labilithrix sp.]|jgi:hypothetical protein|nr:hypothetical protein [Labilithrix sp.]
MAKAMERFRAGNHSLFYERHSGLVCLVHVGTMNGAEMTAVADQIAEYQGRYFPGEPPFMLVDNRQATGFTLDARHALSQHRLPRDEVYAALWGASFAVRTVINLVFKALSIATNAKSAAMAVGSESEARAWLNEQRNLCSRRRNAA